MRRGLLAGLHLLPATRLSNRVRDQVKSIVCTVHGKTGNGGCPPWAAGVAPCMFFLRFFSLWLGMMLSWASNVGFYFKWTRYPLVGSLAMRLIGATTADRDPWTRTTVCGG